MKRLTMVSAVLLVCAGAFAQGTISVQNDTTSLLTTDIGVAVASTSAGGTFKVELFYQANSGGAAPAAINLSGALGNWLPTQYGVFDLIAFNAPTYGIFDPGIATLTGITAGANVWLDLVFWNNNAASLAAALNPITGSMMVIAFSPVWSNGTGGAGSPPGAPLSIIGPSQFSGLALTTPEPTTMAIGALGATCLLAFRRRK